MKLALSAPRRDALPFILESCVIELTRPVSHSVRAMSGGDAGEARLETRMAIAECVGRSRAGAPGA